jgi:metal-sulfur cluster biosynthetic enzyme
MSALINSNPVVYNVPTNIINDINDDLRRITDEDDREIVTREEVFEHIRHINDPEHPLTLEQLHVVSKDLVEVDDSGNRVNVLFTPTIPHCSMATLVGLCIRVKLLRSLPPRFKVLVKISPGSHQSEDAVNKQLADKERVAAALENGHLLDLVNKCIVGTDI